MDTRKTTLRERDALSLLREVNEVYATKGRKVTHFDLRKDKPSGTDLLGAILGPTGNLRAPTLRRGRKLVVGFDEETYAKVFG